MASKRERVPSAPSDALADKTRRAGKSHTGRDLQERAVRTREAILLAAAGVFERSGFAAATIDEIATEAQVTKGALYFHFASKSSVAAAVVEEHHAAWAAIAERAASWNVDALTTLQRLILEVAKSYQASPIARAGVRLGNEFQQVDLELPRPFVGWVERLTVLLRQGQRDGSVSTAISAPAAARVVVGSFFGIQEMSSRLTDRADLIRRVNEWWALLGPTLAGTR